MASTGMAANSQAREPVGSGPQPWEEPRQVQSKTKAGRNEGALSVQRAEDLAGVGHDLAQLRCIG